MNNATGRSLPTWLWMAPLGLVLIGAGFCLAAEGAILKGKGVDSWTWIGMGTLGLVVMNAGISVFGDAVVRRVKAEIRG